MAELTALERVAQSDYTRAQCDLDALKTEVVKSIRGESAFSKEMLFEMVNETEARCEQLKKRWDNAQDALEQASIELKKLEKQYDTFISMAEVYDSASLESKKMIVSRMIARVDVSRGYQLNVCFQPEFKEFFDATENISDAIA